MANFIIADNQELTRFAVERLIRQDESSTIRRASDRAGLVELLKEQENSVVVLDYTMFDFAGEDQPKRRLPLIFFSQLAQCICG